MTDLAVTKLREELQKRDRRIERMIGNEKILTELTKNQMDSISEYQRKEIEYEKRIAELERVIATAKIFEVSQRELVSEQLKRISYGGVRHMARRGYRNFSPATVRKMKKRYAELEGKYYLLIRHTTPRVLVDSLRVAWVDIPKDKSITVYIDEILSEYLKPPKGDDHE